MSSEFKGSNPIGSFIHSKSSASVCGHLPRALLVTSPCSRRPVPVHPCRTLRWVLISLPLLLLDLFFFAFHAMVFYSHSYKTWSDCAVTVWLIYFQCALLSLIIVTAYIHCRILKIEGSWPGTCIQYTRLHENMIFNMKNCITLSSKMWRNLLKHLCKTLP